MIVSIADIRRATMRAFDMDEATLDSRTRKPHLARPRFASYYLARELTEKSFPVIGRCCNRHHSAILTSHRSVKAQLEACDPFMSRTVDRIMAQLMADHGEYREAA